MVYVFALLTDIPALSSAAAIVNVDRLYSYYFIIYDLLGVILHSPIF